MSTRELTYVFPPFRLVPSRRLVLRDELPVKLGGRAFDLLLALIERRERTVAKAELFDIVWPNLVVEENNLQVQVGALRKLLGHPALATIPGRGYRFTLAVSTEGDGAESEQDVSGPSPAARAVPTNLPAWLPPLIGRDEALEALLALLDRHTWVTVTGPAGIGKTRLARAAARQWLPQAPGGVWWVDLAPVVDPGLVPNAVALATGAIAGAHGDILRAIVDALANQASLLVLDNAEHLLDAVAALLARLRPLCPGLRLLLTSQEVLHAADEQVFRLEALSLPARHTLEAACASGAVALFATRAKAAAREFELNADTLGDAIEICSRLDGIPLAIELAAARVGVLGVRGVRARLDNRFQLLRSGDRTALRRHRTLREAVDWSYRLLSDDEKAVFRRLGVLVGSFTLEAALAISEDGDRIDRWDALEHLSALVDKSMVVAEGDPLPRYRMLETLRLFALERLIEHRETEAARAAHVEHYSGVAESGRELLAASPDAKGLRLLDSERDNILLAMEWACAGADAGVGLRLAVDMRLYWTSRDLIGRGLAFGRLALLHPGAVHASALVVNVRIGVATFCTMLNEHRQAVDEAAAAVGVARELGDEGLLAKALATLAAAHIGCNRLEDAERCGTEALAVARRSGENLVFVLSRLAAICIRREAFDRARDLLEEELSLSLGNNQARGQLAPRLNLALVCIELGDMTVARGHLEATLPLVRMLETRHFGAGLVRAVAIWSVATGRHEAALLLHAAYVRLCDHAGVDSDLERYELSRLKAAREALDAGKVLEFERRGQSWSYDEALAQAGEVLEGSAL